jgi:hypothetical protein
MIYIVEIANLRVGLDKVFVRGNRISLSNDIAAKLIKKGYIKLVTDSSEDIVEVSYSDESNVSNESINGINSIEKGQENNNEQQEDSEGPPTDLDVKEYVQNNKPGKKGKK